MKRVIDTTEVLGTVDLPKGEYEVCASADAQYNEETGRLVVELNSFLRSTNLRVKEERLSADWLPAAQTVNESVGLEEALELARDIFHRWVRKVRQVIPSLHTHPG